MEEKVTERTDFRVLAGLAIFVVVATAVRILTM